MKRKLISLITLLLFTFLLVGCDFGNQTVPTTLAPTTEAPTTVAPTTAAPTTVEVTTQEVTTTAGGTTTTMVEYYDVVFYNGDGMILESQSIESGMAATAPANSPVKADDGVDSFVFDSWDSDFSSITGNLDVYPIFTTEFNRSVLLTLVNEMFTPDDPEILIDEMLDMTETPDEEALYYLLGDMWGLYEELFGIRTGSELQTWYAATKAAGFDKTLFITSFYNAMNNGIANDLNYATDYIADYTLDLSNLSAELAIIEGNILAFEAEQVSYCTTGVPLGLEVDCQNYWDALLYEVELERAYSDQLDETAWGNPMFNWYVYDQIQNMKENILYYDIVMQNPSEVDRLTQNLDNYLSEIDQDELDIYMPLLALFETFRSMQFELYETPTYPQLDVPDLAGVYDVKHSLHMLLWGNDMDYSYGEMHYFGYAHQLFELDRVERDIAWMTERLESAEDDLERLTVTVGFISDPAYEQNIKDLMGTAYDALDAVILTVDDPTVDMIVDYAMDFLFISTPYLGQTQFVDYDSHMNDGMDIDFLQFVTAENIEFMADRINTTILAIYGTLDPADFANGKLLLLAYLEDMLLAEGVDPLDVADMLVEYGLTFDKLVGHFNTLVVEVTSLLSSIDNTKAAALVALIEGQNFMFMSDIDITIYVAQLVEILDVENTFDVSAILQAVVDIYFEVDENNTLTPAEVLAIQADIDTYVTDTLALFAVVAGYDSSSLSVIEVENVLTLMARVIRVQEWFDNGFSNINDPIVPYYDGLFDNFVWNYMDGIIEPMDAITLFEGILGTVDNPSTYYSIRSIQQYITGFTSIRSFGDLQTWMGNLESFGFTQDQIVNYLMDLGAWYSAEFKDGTPRFLDEISWIQQEVDYWTDNYDNAMQDVVDYDAMVDMYVQYFDPMYQVDAADYWQALKDGVLLEQERSMIEDELRWRTDGNNVDYLMSILNDIIMYETDPINLAVAEASYATFLSDHSYDGYIQSLIADYRICHLDSYYYYDDVIDPLLDVIDDADYGVYTDFLGITNEHIMYYDQTTRDINWYEMEIMRYEEKLDRMYGDLDFIRFIDGILNDPTLFTDTEVAANLILDDLQNMVANMDPTSFELLEQIVDFAMMMDRYDGKMSVDLLPFTTAELYEFTQDLSAFLKLRASTLDTADLAILEAYILTMITEIIENSDMDPLDQPAEVVRINALVLKYIGFADDALDEFTIMLDGLVEADIELLLTTISAFADGGYSVYQQVVLVAQTMDAIYDPTAVDLDVIIEMLLEVYFDMEMPGYVAQDLTDTQAAWNLHISEIETIVATVALYDINAIDPINYPALIELQEAVMFLGIMFEDPTSILTTTFGGYTFDMMYLNDIISEMFNETDPLVVTDLADSFIGILGLTAMDYETLYYELLGFGSIIRSMPRIESPLDLLKVYEGIKSLGYTNVEIAQIVMNGVMDLLYPELGNMIDTTWIDDELVNLADEMQYYLDDIANVEINVMYEIGLVYHIDPVTQAAIIMDATNYWNSMKAEVQSYSYYDQMLNQYSWDYENFDWGLWDELQGASDDDDMYRLNELFGYMNGEEQNMYSQLLNAYETFKGDEEYNEMLRQDFENNYGYYPTSYDEYYPLAQYLYDNAYNMMYSYMEMARVQDTIYRTQEELDNMLQMAWLPETIEELFMDPSNVLLAEEVLVIFLDQLDAWAASPDLEVINYVEMLIKKGPAGLEMADIAAEIMRVGSFLSTMLGTIDAADEATLIDFAVAVTDAYSDTQYELAQAVVMKVYFETVINDVLPEILDVPSILGSFLLTFDETKTEEVFTSVIEMFLLCPMDPNMYVREIINVSGIINSVLGDASLNYTDLVSPVYKVIFEAMTLSGYPPMDPVQQTIDEITMTLDDLLAFAITVSAFDPAHMSDAQMIVVDDFEMALEGLYELLDDLFD